MKTALLYNGRPAGMPAGGPDDSFEEYDSASTIDSIAAALRKLGHDVTPVVADIELPRRLAEGRFHFVFNIAEGKGRRCREAVPASICELLEVPYTGSDALTLGITLDKQIAKRVVSPEVPVARGVLVEGAEDEVAVKCLSFPVIVKPNDEGSSKGIRDNPVYGDFAKAVERCRLLRARYQCPALVEEFLSGPEVTVAVVGNRPNVRVLGLMEIAPAGNSANFVYSIEVKRDWRNRVRYHIPPRLDTATVERIKSEALSAYHLLGCRDIARMDFRLDSGGTPRFIECNPLPGLDPVNSDMVILSRDILPYDQLVQSILLTAMERVGKNSA
jgi:D-alanine-D-alanine ligase